jgi:hypothetical protein
MGGVWLSVGVPSFLNLTIRFSFSRVLQLINQIGVDI